MRRDLVAALAQLRDDGVGDAHPFVRGDREAHGGQYDWHAFLATIAWGDERAARWQRATYAWMLRRRGLARTRAAAGLNVAGALGRAALFPSARRANLGWARLHRVGLELRP